MISAPSTLFEIHKEAEESVVTLYYLADCSSFSLGQKKKRERDSGIWSTLWTGIAQKNVDS